MCSLKQVKVLVSTARRGAREVFFQMVFDWLDPIMAK
jgi:hypothetical protein